MVDNSIFNTLDIPFKVVLHCLLFIITDNFGCLRKVVKTVNGNGAQKKGSNKIMVNEDRRF